MTPQYLAAVNRLVALVKVNITNKVPFDTSINNNHTYFSGLTPWTIKSELKEFTNHLKDCFVDSKKDRKI